MMQLSYEAIDAGRRLIYEVAGQQIVVDAGDSWAAEVVEKFFSGWYLILSNPSPACDSLEAADIIFNRNVTAPIIPRSWSRFEIAGGGTCWSDGRTSYVELEGSVIAYGHAPNDTVEVWIPKPLEVTSPALTRIVTYALSAALRRRRLFELHSGAVIEPQSETGVLIIGPSGSGKSTLTVQLATAGWSFLTDDVLVLDLANARVTAWPMRRSFAITSETYASSSFLQQTASLDYLQIQFADKRQFTPHTTFASNFSERCIPATLFFTELGNVECSSVTRLTTAETMSRLIRMNPWCCYDRSTASEHLATLSGLASQSTGYSLLAGRDLLEPQIAADLLARYAQAGRKQ